MTPSPSPPERGSGPGGVGLTRRDALRALGLALFGAPVACAARSAPFAPLGVQLYTLREPMARDVDGTLERVAAIGYREVEFAGYFGRSPAEIRAALDAAGLASPSTHLGVDALDDLPRALDAAATLGHAWIVVPSLPRDMTSSLDAWRRTAERFNRAGEEARAAGIGLAFHNHGRDARRLEGRVPLEVFLEATEPGLVGVQADVHWLADGGVEPAPFLDRWHGRIPSLHVKDRTTGGAMADVGEGDIEWRAVLEAARRAGVGHYFVEHDRPGDPFASVRASFDYLDSLDLGDP